MKALIVTGGNIEPELMIPYIKEQEFELVIGVDHGCDFFQVLQCKPDLIVGDFDSIDQSTLSDYKNQGVEVLTYPSEKDETDTELGIRVAIERGADEIHLLGATGTRLDHVLGNIQLLKYAYNLKADCRIVDGHNRVRMVAKELTLVKKQQYGKYLSLIPYLGEAVGVTLTGMKYSLKNENLPTGIARGVSNEIVDEVASISITSGWLLVIESKD